MMTEDLLLLQVLGHPEDTQARLVYADWLEEQGSPDETTLAELLRVRAALAALTADDSRRVVLAVREAILLRSHGTTWGTPRRRRFLVTGLYSRARPHVNVGTIGHCDHGKTTLTAAIVARQAHQTGSAQFRTARQIAAHVHAEGLQHVAVPPAYAEYETANRHYAHIDCHGNPESVKSVLAAAAQMDGAVLVVAASDGIMPLTREHLLLVRQAGVSRLVVFLNKVETVDDPELIELVEVEIRELLTRYDFPGEEVPIIRGNALPALLSNGTDDAACGCIDELLGVLDSSIPLPPGQEGPFLMPVAATYSISGCGTVAAGRIERGQVKAGDEVEVLGLATQTHRVVVGNVEIFGKPAGVGLPRDMVGLQLRGLERSELRRGQVLAEPGSVRLHTRFEASVYVLSKSEGGRHTPFSTGFCPQFYFATARVTGCVELHEGDEMAMPGDNVKLTVQLPPRSPVVLKEGQRFVIREGGRTIGAGVVTAIRQ
jgi:elongation factor Tu